MQWHPTCEAQVQCEYIFGILTTHLGGMGLFQLLPFHQNCGKMYEGMLIYESCLHHLIRILENLG